MELPTQPGHYHVALKTTITLEVFELLHMLYSGKNNGRSIDKFPPRTIETFIFPDPDAIQSAQLFHVIFGYNWSIHKNGTPKEYGKRKMEDDLDKFFRILKPYPCFEVAPKS